MNKRTAIDDLVIKHSIVLNSYSAWVIEKNKHCQNKEQPKNVLVFG